jgi:hypothetical protein
MSETVDLTLLFGLVQGIDRELRLLRLQFENVAPRVTIMEQSFHDLVAEVARGFGQVQQQMTRHEKRFDALDSGLASLQAELADSTTRIMAAWQADLADNTSRTTRIVAAFQAELTDSTARILHAIEARP